MRPTPLRLAALVLVAGALAAASCSGDDESSATTSEADGLVVFAASSLTDVFQELAPDATFNFAGSNALATQIREGAPADVYAAASPRYPEELAAAGFVERPEPFATNRLVVIVPAGNPAGIESVDDLGAPGVRLVVGAEGVPIGDYTRTVLDSLGKTDVLDNVVSNEDDVRGVLGKVVMGEADAGFVYVTDARPVSDQVTVVRIPAWAQPRVRYEIAVVARSSNKAAARAWVDALLSNRGRTALKNAGFLPVPKAAS
jgi:molybdate transport system substrate-binding protein